MNDVSSLTVLPNGVFSKILETNNNSVYSISQLYEEEGVHPNMEICQRIYEVIKLNDERMIDQEKIAEKVLKK